MSKLYEAFAGIKSEKEFNSFLADLCTPSEIAALNERWKIAELLYSGGMAQLAIAKKTGASITTVSRVARFLNNEKFGGYRAVLARFHHA